jgi:hypothetical protein
MQSMRSASRALETCSDFLNAGSCVAGRSDDLQWGRRPEAGKLMTVVLVSSESRGCWNKA